MASGKSGQRAGMRVVVAGAGIGGLAVARGMERVGHECAVYEQAEALRVSGAAVTLWPNGIAALSRLGVSVDGLGRRMDRLEIRSAQGRRISVIDGTRLARRFGVPAIVVPRRQLIEHLAEGLSPNTVHFGQGCVGVRQDGAGAILEVDNGELVAGDLVVAADGHRSAVRTSLLGGGPAEPTGWAEWQGLSRFADQFTDGYSSLSLVDKDGACALMPAGEGLLQWWFAVRWAPDTPRPPSVVSMLRDRFGSWISPVPELLETLSDDGINFWPYVRHRVPKSLATGRVVLVGDAAHAMPPTFGQGANQTLEDAAVLTAQIRNESVASAVRGYDRARRHRAAAVSRLALRSPAQDAQTPWARFTTIPPTPFTWFFGSFLWAVSNSLRQRPSGQLPPH